MRQSGRTSRIIDFTIDQLFSVGECIVTDHYVFEYPDAGVRHLTYFIDKVYARYAILNRDENFKLDQTIVRVGKVPMIHFKIVSNKEDEKNNNFFK
jgi:hypothetical protein